MCGEVVQIGAVDFLVERTGLVEGERALKVLYVVVHVSGKVGTMKVADAQMQNARREFRRIISRDGQFACFFEFERSMTFVCPLARALSKISSMAPSNPFRATRFLRLFLDGI